MSKIIILADFSEEYFKKILLGVVRYSKENGTWVFCRMPAYYRETLGIDSILKWAREWNATGMLVQINNDNDSETLSKAGFPVIAQDFMERFSNLPNITGDYYNTGRIGAEYFMNKGFNHFAFYGFPNFVWSRERGEGFSKYLESKGKKVSFYENDHSYEPNLWYYKASKLSQWLSELPKPVAIMACDDNRGQHITEACKLAGIKIPEEVAILGVDNDELICELSDPPLSSISLDAEKGGYEAAKLLDMLMHDPNSNYSDVIVSPLQVITRQSTDIYATPDIEISRSLKFIHQNCDRNLLVTDVLEVVALSRRAFEIRFKKVTGVSVYQYYLKLRIDRLARRLIETDKPVNEIAIDLGFNEFNNLSRMFKQIKGCSPLEYRKKHKP
jgi:LacI family transcriptional regulator